MAAAVALVGASLVWGGRRAQSVREEAFAAAQGAARQALDRAVAAVGEAPASVAEQAASLAALDGMRKMMPAANTADPEGFEAWVKTLQGNLEEEDWSQEWRELGTVGFALGGRVIYATRALEQVEALIVPLLHDAETSGRATGLGTLGEQVVLIGLGRVEPRTPRQERGVVALLTPLSKRLEGIAQRAGATVTLFEAHGDVSAGDAREVARLKVAAHSADPGAEPCCAFHPLAQGARLAVWVDPEPVLASAERAGRRELTVAGLVGLLVGAAALILGFRRATNPERDRLLVETKAALARSREELQRLSTRISGTQRTATPVPLGSEDGAMDQTAAIAPSRYLELAPLGEGGMARISVAEVSGAEGFRRLFVVKRLRPELAHNSDVVSQFIDEARLGASLVHSNIIPVFDFGRDAEGYYLAQEYILGRDVDAVVHASKSRRGRPLEVPIVLYLAQEALKALSYAHGKKDDAGRPVALVHRDVSPNNLIVTARGEVKLLDFGIVKSEQRLTKTQAGVVKGNLFFMSPEQARAKAVDSRSDLFSLGMVLYAAAVGAPLYKGKSTFELLSRAGIGPTEEDLQKIAALEAPLGALVARAVAVDPAARFQTADEFARAVASSGGVATSVDVQALMDWLFRDELAAEASRFSRSGG